MLNVPFYVVPQYAAIFSNVTPELKYDLCISGKSDPFNKGKDKAVPLKAWSGPKGSRKLRFPDFMTTVQDGGKVVSLFC